MERDLLTWYEALGAAAEIRGYGPVKEGAARRIRADVERLAPRQRLDGVIRDRCAGESAALP